MEIPYSRWHAAIPRRRARRRYSRVPLEAEQIAQLQRVCKEFRPFPQVRAELITESPDEVLRGIVASYGKVKGAPAVFAFVGDVNDPNINEKVGYTGEGIILEATAMGLGTCWVGGTVFFRRGVTEARVGAGKNDKVWAVSPVGHAVEGFTTEEKAMTGFGLAHRRKPLRELVKGLDEKAWSGWIKAGLEAARLAPSAVNRQPWRFYVEPDSVTVSSDNSLFEWGISKRLDCGIAMLHIEVAALDSGVRGRWEFLKAPEVARFVV